MKVFHHGKFDLSFLRRCGLPVGGHVFDTMLASQLLSAGMYGKGHSLADLVKEYFGEGLCKKQQTSAWDGTVTGEQLEYAARDAAVLLGLREALIQRIGKAGLREAAKLEFDCLPAVVEMELHGMCIDRERLDSLNQKLELQREELADALKEHFNLSHLNPNSPQQLLEALRASGVPVQSTNRYTLAPLADTPPDCEYRP